MQLAGDLRLSELEPTTDVSLLRFATRGDIITSGPNMRLLYGIILASAMLQPKAAAVKPHTYWRQKTDLAEDMLLLPGGSEYQAQIGAMHKKIWPTVAKKCARQIRDEGIAVVDAVMEIGADGHVMDFIPRPQGESDRCVKAQMIGKAYLSPPYAPFYSRIYMRVRGVAS